MWFWAAQTPNIDDFQLAQKPCIKNPSVQRGPENFAYLALAASKTMILMSAVLQGGCCRTRRPHFILGGSRPTPPNYVSRTQEGLVDWNKVCTNTTPKQAENNRNGTHQPKHYDFERYCISFATFRRRSETLNCKSRGVRWTRIPSLVPRLPPTPQA